MIYSDELIKVSNVSYSYNSENGEIQALDNINFSINNKEFLCLLGPSGCGKSILLKLIAGFMQPTSGEITMSGNDIGEPDWNRGVVFQTPNLYPWYTVWDNVAYGLKMRKFQKEDIKDKTEAYLALVGLSDYKMRKPYELSGGMKQRVALARALVNEPKVLLMDEPFSALDALTRRTMQDLITEIWEKTGITIFMITHDVEEALVLGTRVLVMSKQPGKIIEDKDTRDIYGHFGETEADYGYTIKCNQTKMELLSLLI